MNYNVLQNANKSQIIMHPFPYIVVENALPVDVYEHLETTWPEELLSSNYENLTDEKGHTKRYLSSKVLQDKIVSTAWLEFFEFHLSNEFYKNAVYLFEDAIKKYYPDQVTDILNGAVVPRNKVNQNTNTTPFVTDCQFVQNKPLSDAETSRTPHLDNPQEIYAALLYMKKKDDNSTGRNFQIYESIHPQPRLGKKRTIEETELRISRTVEYKPNTLVMFLNCRHGAHSVSSARSSHVRRSINIIGEYGNGNQLFKL